MKTLNHRQRLEACLHQVPLDRPPVALWRHFPIDDQTPAGLAAATLNYQSQFDFDFVKVTPITAPYGNFLAARRAVERIG